MYSIIEPVSGIRLIRLPLPFELNHVQVGLVRVDDGYLLIDTGMDTEESFQAFSAALESLGVAWPEIRQVLVTHMHPDHIGLLGRVLSLTGAKLLMHAAEVEHLNTMVDAGRPPWIDEGLKLAGSPHSMSVAIHHTLAHLRDALHRVQPDMLLHGGEEIATSLGPARVVWTPGHTVGHVCLYWPEQRLLYSGDHLIEKITPNIGWLPERDCLAEYLNSLERLLAYDVDLILPSHGDPFRGHAAWIQKTMAHHQERCGRLRGALEVQARNAHHMVPVLWDRHLSPFHYHFALFEVLAHLEYMRRCGQIGAESGADGAVMWTADGTSAA